MAKPFDLDALIKRQLQTREPDPHVLARKVAARVPDDMLRAVMGDLLVERVSFLLRMQRASHDESASPTNLPKSNGEAAGRSKWHCDDRWPTPSGWKFQAELTAQDCDWLAREYQQRADANQRIADEFRLLAERLRATGVERVGDLEDLGEAA
jgi:hypothetical protein